MPFCLSCACDCNHIRKPILRGIVWLNTNQNYDFLRVFALRGGKNMESGRICIKSERRGNWLLALACFVALTGFASAASAYDLPQDRVITWMGNVGVKGGIPARTTEINCTQSPYNVPTDGVTAAQTAINSCLNGISAEQAAYLPAGTYTITASINVPSYKTLRGAGPGVTIIRANSSFGNYLSNGLITMSGGFTTRTATTVVNITSMTKGSPTVVLSDASAFSLGDYMFIDVLNGSWANVTENCGVYGGGQTRCFNTMHKITNKVGNTLTIDPPVIHPSYQSDTPQAVRVSHTMRTRAGVENITIKNDSGVTSASNNNNVFMQGTSECWVKNVKIERCGRYCILTFFDNYKPEIRDSWITGCINPVPSDYCYGTAYYHAWFGLIENNIYQSTSEGPIIGNSSGNVIAYNYGKDVQREDPSAAGWFMGGDWSHMLHSSYNLWEGEYGEGIMLDNIHGSSGHQTIFRSRYLAKKENNICMGPATCNFAYAIALGRYQYYQNIIGSVLGTDGYNTKYDEATFASGDFNIYSTGYDGASGSQDATVVSTLLRHANFDYVTDSVKLCNGAGEPGCQGGTSDTTLPASLYLTAKPSWWGSQPWPPIGPDVPGYASSIPAKDRFDGAPPPVSYIVTPSAGPNGIISPNTPRTVNVGTTATFTVIPNAGYTASVGGSCGGTLTGSTYTTSSVTANCTVTATFTQIPGGTQTRPASPPAVNVTTP